MSEYGDRPAEGDPAPSRPNSFPAAAPYALRQPPRYPDPQRSDFRPYSGPYAESYGTQYDTSTGYLQPYPGPHPDVAQRPPYPTQREHPQAGTVLALGVIGLMVPLVSFVAWYLGSRAEHEIEDLDLRYVNSGTLMAGKVLGMIVSILQILGAAALMIAIVFAVLASSG